MEDGENILKNLSDQDWQRLYSYSNLYDAYKKARKGKQHRKEVALFSLNLENHLWRLMIELSHQTYRPGEYRQFTLYERKPRIISVAPFRDRVVHHALMTVLEPFIDDQLIPHTYANRKNKGVHAAVDHYQRCAKRFAYAIKVDISQYFHCIDHQILKKHIKTSIQHSKIARLCEQIIDSSPENEKYHVFYYQGDDLLTPLNRKTGLAIGNLTSQWFANWYLDVFDQWVVKDLQQGTAYLRYVDDLFLFHDEKAVLWEKLERIKLFLSENLRLTVHPHKIQLRPCCKKMDVLGYQVSRSRRWLRNDNGYRFQRRLKKMANDYRQGRLDMNDVKTRVASWQGHARHGQTDQLQDQIFKEVTFKK